LKLLKWPIIIIIIIEDRESSEYWLTIDPMTDSIIIIDDQTIIIIDSNDHMTQLLMTNYWNEGQWPMTNYYYWLLNYYWLWANGQCEWPTIIDSIINDYWRVMTMIIIIIG